MKSNINDINDNEMIIMKIINEIMIIININV